MPTPTTPSLPPSTTPAGWEEEIASLAKALGHPARVRILHLLLERNECVCGDICKELPLAQSTVSQHLKVLRSAGLVRGTVEGPSVCYCADASALRKLFRHLGALLELDASCCETGADTHPHASSDEGR